MIITTLCILELPIGRLDRKRQQIESLVSYALGLLPKSGGTLVEFCAGGGYCGLLVAFLRPDVSVYLTDMNAISLKFAECKAKKFGLRNVRCSVFPMQWLVQRNEDNTHIDNSSDDSNASCGVEGVSMIIPPREMPHKFHVGVALHACGSSSDVVMRICMQSSSSFVICPCCYGSIKQYYPKDSCHIVDEKRRFLACCTPARQGQLNSCDLPAGVDLSSRAADQVDGAVAPLGAKPVSLAGRWDDFH